MTLPGVAWGDTIVDGKKFCELSPSCRSRVGFPVHGLMDSACFWARRWRSGLGRDGMAKGAGRPVEDVEAFALNLVVNMVHGFAASAAALSCGLKRVRCMNSGDFFVAVVPV